MITSLMLAAGQQVVLEDLPEWQLDIIPASEFITASGLASLVGVTQGVAQFENTDWLLFKNNITGSERIIPKKPIRHSVSGSHLESATPKNGSKVISIQGKQYAIRLIRGITRDPAGSNSSAVPVPGREFNELFYSICSDRPVDWKGPHQLANFSMAELGMTSANKGHRCWIAEMWYGTNKCYRPNTFYLTSVTGAGETATANTQGWRPILIKV